MCGFIETYDHSQGVPRKDIITDPEEGDNEITKQKKDFIAWCLKDHSKEENPFSTLQEQIEILEQNYKPDNSEEDSVS